MQRSVPYEVAAAILALAGAATLVAVFFPLLNPGMHRVETGHTGEPWTRYVFLTALPVLILATSLWLNRKAQELWGEKTNHRKFTIWFTIFVVLFSLIGLVMISGPISRASNSPLIQEISAMQQICKRLRDYDYNHPGLKPENVAGQSLTNYVALGILSPEDVVYIRDHGIRFLGFDPLKIGGDIPVLEATYTNGRLRKSIVGYSDASVVTYGPLRSQ